MFSESDKTSGAVVLGLMLLSVGLTLVLVLSFAIRTLKRAPPATQLALPAPPVKAPGADAAQIRRDETLAASDAASVHIEYGVVKFYFEPEHAQLAPGSLQALTQVLEAAKSGRGLVISGFHDPTGDAQKNAALAAQRAQVVQVALKEAGVAPAQIIMRNALPVSPNESYAASRRVEISVQ